MIRNLKALGLALVAALALGAVAASAASAESALFTFGGEVGAGETVTGSGEQVGTNTFTVNGLNLTCATATASGQALSSGPSSTKVTLSPVYEGCHVVVSTLTKLVTVTMNECSYDFDATKNTPAGTFGADLQITCPMGKEIEVHVYNSATSEATTLCTYDIPPQTINGGIELTNDTSHSPDDILAHINLTLASIHATVNNALCSNNNTHPTATYTGTFTIKAFKAGKQVDLTVS